MTDTFDLWEEFIHELPPAPKDDSKKVVSKLKNQKTPKTPEKILKSKTVSLEDKLEVIRNSVMNTLGTYVNSTMIIKSKEELHKYFECAIKNQVLAVDTETNNSLDPITCKIMGLCLYTPGQKNAYAPVNHINYKTGERLDWQITEDDIY